MTIPCSSNILVFYEFYDIIKCSIQYHNKNVPSITILRVLNISPFSTDTRKWLCHHGTNSPSKHETLQQWVDVMHLLRDCASLGRRDCRLVCPSNTIRWPNAALMLGHWPNIMAALDQRLVFAGLQYRREWSGMSGSLLSGSDPGITARRHVWLPCLTTRPCQWSDPRMRVMNIQTSRGCPACWVLLYILDLMTYTLS